MNFVIFGIPIHFCQQEAAMAVLMLGCLGGMWAWVKAKFKKHERAEAEAHHKCCVHGAHPKSHKNCKKCM